MNTRELNERKRELAKTIRSLPFPIPFDKLPEYLQFFDFTDENCWHNWCTKEREVYREEFEYMLARGYIAKSFTELKNKWDEDLTKWMLEQEYLMGVNGDIEPVA